MALKGVPVPGFVYNYLSTQESANLNSVLNDKNIILFLINIRVSLLWR